jgi:SAM-dependent methyltransferase
MTTGPITPPQELSMAKDAPVEIADRARFWDTQARNSGGDPNRAAGLDSSEENLAIDRVQSALLTSAMDRICGEKNLAGAAVLDFGCGSGRWVSLLKGYGCRYYGVDFSSGMLDVARRCHPGTDFRTVGGDVIPFDDRTFDLAWSVAVIQHNPPHQQERILAELARVLRNGALLVALEGIGSGPVPRDGIYYPRTRKSWIDLAARQGLRLRWRRGARYFVIRAIGHALRGRQFGTRPSFWLRGAARIDAVLCPHLTGLLPHRLQTRAVMVFQKE